MFSTPILLIVYNRPDYTIKLLEAIKAIKPTAIYIAADGPKNEADKILIDKTRAVFNAIDWQCTLKTYYREQNEGCGVGVSNGIDWFFSQVEYGIILEDDCIPAPSFFSFTEHLLIKYKENETVMMIGGSSWLDVHFKYQDDYFFTNLTSIWGWATWKRAWQKYQFTITPDMIKQANEKKVWNEFSNKQIKEFRVKLLQATFDKKVDTWDIQWSFCMSLNKGIAILPIKNQITNIGVYGTNYKTETQLTNLNTDTIDVANLKHPTNIAVDKKMDILYQNLEAKKFLSINEPLYRYYFNKTKFYILKFLLSIGYKHENSIR